MQIIQDLTKYAEKIKFWYMEYFKETETDVACIFKMLDFELAHGIADDNGGLINCVFPVERDVFTEAKTYKTLNFTCVMTDIKYRHKGYAKKLIDFLIDKYKDTYECMYLQTENWDLYKNFSLVDNTKKVVCQYKPGLYPTPMLIIWDRPRAELMQEIESQPTEDCIGVKRSLKQITATIEMYQQEGCLFVANPGAYIWYTPDKKIIEMQYSTLSNLIWLMHHIQPMGDFLMYNVPELDEIIALIKTEKEVVITKNFAASKIKLKNLKLNDYLI